MIYVVAQQHPTLPEVSMFTTKSKADADQYRAIGWTVLEIEEPVQPAAKPGRTNSGDETGGTVKRFGFDISNGKSDIIPATNGAYVYYDDYLALYIQIKAQPVQLAPLTYPQMMQMYLADKDAGAHRSPESNYWAGIKAAISTTVQPVPLTDADILALNANEVFFSESPSKYPEAGHGTQYHAGAPGVIAFARAVLNLRTGGAG